MFSGFGGLWEDAEENFAISADRQVEALAKFFTRPQPQTYTSFVFEMPLKHKKALFLKLTNQNNTQLFLKCTLMRMRESAKKTSQTRCLFINL